MQRRKTCRQRRTCRSQRLSGNLWNLSLKETVTRTNFCYCLVFTDRLQLHYTQLSHLSTGGHKTYNYGGGEDRREGLSSKFIQESNSCFAANWGEVFFIQQKWYLYVSSARPERTMYLCIWRYEAAVYNAGKNWRAKSASILYNYWKIL